MKVSLIDFTGSGHADPANYAASVLIFTKMTRLEMNPGLFSEITHWPQNRKLQELEYMANTIPSSWEFVDYTFLIEGVSRGYTHQAVRTRTASFAQQTMRVLDVTGWQYLAGPTVLTDDSRKAVYDKGMSVIDTVYRRLIEDGAAIEDARGVLPTNILTNLVMKINMRNWVELVRKRSSSRVQGEYRAVLTEMKAAVRAVHPWIDLFIDRTFDRAAQELEAAIKQHATGEAQIAMIKLIDQMRALS